MALFYLPGSGAAAASSKPMGGGAAVPFVAS